jgi:hypothetical protein
LPTFVVTKPSMMELGTGPTKLLGPTEEGKTFVA